MEKRLAALFEYQKYEKDPRLQRLIEETEARFGRELNDDDLKNISAAGEIIPPPPKQP